MDTKPESNCQSVDSNEQSVSDKTFPANNNLSDNRVEFEKDTLTTIKCVCE